ncbi:MAG: toll/interleukin-1 receptor domain-containing protein, partial [Cyanobacteria bacterium P01_E01_bin.45]
HDRLIPLGNEWEPEIHENLNRAQIILLLISVDFISSRYCRDIELKRAMERHEAKEAQVIPIILRPCDWESAAFGKLQGIHAGQPISIWDDRDSAWTLVAKQLRKTIEEKQGNKDKR